MREIILQKCTWDPWPSSTCKPLLCHPGDCLMDRLRQDWAGNHPDVPQCLKNKCYPCAVVVSTKDDENLGAHEGYLWKWSQNKMTRLRIKKKMTISGRQDLTPRSMYSLLYSFTSSLQLSNSYNHMDKAELILKNKVCMNYELSKNIILIENKFHAIW